MILDPEARRAYMGKNVTTFYDALPQAVRASGSPGWTSTRSW